MAHARLDIHLHDGVWVSEVSTAHPEAAFEVLAAVPGDDRGFALVRISAEDPEAIVSDMHAHPQLSEVTIAHWQPTEVTLHFETTAPLLLFSSREAGVPIELPVEIRNGIATVEVTGSRERLSDLADQLEGFGLEFDVQHIGERTGIDQVLSDRQQEVIIAAVESGYYDTPRGCTLTELADRLGIAKSTCSEILHRAEEVIVKRFVGRLGRTQEPERSVPNK